jgi:hypothetical protein
MTLSLAEAWQLLSRARRLVERVSQHSQRLLSAEQR